jgi:hypothetical protein
LVADVWRVYGPSGISGGNILDIEAGPFGQRGHQAGRHGCIVCSAVGRDVKRTTANDVYVRPSNQVAKVKLWWPGEFERSAQSVADR